MKKTLLAIVILSSFSATAFAHKAGDIIVRGGATMVSPDSIKAPVFIGGDSSAGLSLSVEDNTQLGLNLVYFFDTNWAVELLAATPFTHDITIHDPNAAIGVDGVKLAEVTHLPPTLSTLYYFDTGTAFKPYVGLGVNYTHFFNEEFESGPKELGFSNLELDSSFGLSVQLGADYELSEHWSVNASARYIDINTDATFDVGGESIGKSTVDIDPMVYSVMLGYKF